MPLPARFHQLDPGLDAFFAAQCGCEESGAPVSVLSALTRAELDPWLEGARLAKLPRSVAARELARLIVGFAQESRGSSETLRLSERLVGRLPKPKAAGMTDPLARAHNAAPVVLWLAGLLFACVLVGILGHLFAQ